MARSPYFSSEKIEISEAFEESPSRVSVSPMDQSETG